MTSILLDEIQPQKKKSSTFRWCSVSTVPFYKSNNDQPLRQLFITSRQPTHYCENCWKEGSVPLCVAKPTSLHFLFYFSSPVNTREMFHLLRPGFRKMAHMQECQSRGAEDWRWAVTGNWKREKRSRLLVQSVETHFPNSDVSVEYIMQSRPEGWGNSQK